MNHTATPWAHRPSRYGSWGLISGGDGLPVANTDCLARTPEEGRHRVYGENGFPEPEEVEANAKFIVHACNAHDDLLAACKEELAEHEQCIDDPQHYSYSRSWHASRVETLRAAISKAEGGA